MINSATRAIRETGDSTILQRIAERDESAVRECIDAYGNFIWALSRKHTASRQAAETATEEIFADIWRYCEQDKKIQFAEKNLIAMIALRRLIKHRHCSENESVSRTMMIERARGRENG